MTKLASPIAAQSGVLLESYGPNAVVLDKSLAITREQFVDGVDFTVTLPNGSTETVRIESAPTSAVDGATVVSIVSVAPGFSCAPHPGAAWSVVSAD
ncbi:hypothetical protein [Caballeronia cordobensis]|uniref:hypothetical protein n=1 Tax=Caballeronia cordobensis TaxID=1353886 RepID=UPI00045F02F6|nr:hypothetical protein BRPE67_ACDS09530 [Burkholderia sp. RPE67]